MFEGPKSALKRIQNSDEGTKRRWVIGASAITMLIIVVLWLYYINFLIKPIESEKQEGSGNEFWPVFKNGLTITIDSLKNQINDIISKIMTERQIEIQK